MEQDINAELGALTQPMDYIVHAASNADPVSFAKYPVETLKANFMGTERLLSLAGQWHSRLLFVSSGEMYGQMPAGAPPFVETDCGTVDHSSPRACYPAGKRAAEVLCQPRLAIGTQVYRAKITLETPDLFAWTAVVIVLSFLLEYALGLLFRRLGKGAKL